MMTALGLIESVKRPFFHGDEANDIAYPLDEKIDLQIIDGNRSRYTQVFSQNAAQLYAELTENEAVGMLKRLLGVEIEKASLSKLAQSVAEKYIYKPTNQSNETESMDEQEEVADVAEIDCNAESSESEGFITQRLKELEAREDIDEIVKSAIDGKVEGVEGAAGSKRMQAEVAGQKTVAYALADGTGVPGLKKELLSAKGKGGGKARTFEAKIGCVFWQNFDEGGLPMLEKGNIIRQSNTTKYTGTTNKIDMFDPQFAQFVESQGINGADQVVFLGDGATWIWNMQKRQCPNAICIIDFFHATEHLNGTIGELRFHSAEKREEFRAECYRLLELGEIGQLASIINGKANTANAEKISDCLSYFTENAEKMRYGLFRAAGLFIGSGVIEAACKTIVGKRMKNTGMHWSKKNAEGMIALRCAINSGEFDSDKVDAVA